MTDGSGSRSSDFASSASSSWGFGNFILSYRQSIALVLIAITLFMAYWAAHVPIATRFEDLFPANHPNVRLYRQFRSQYGGAQTLILMIRVQKGDIFNYQTLHAIQDITYAVNDMPGVNHNEVFSLASYRVLYARVEPGALVSAPYMYPKVPSTQAQLDELRLLVHAHREQLAAWVTQDAKGAMVIASFNEQGTDYKQIFDTLQKLIGKYSNANTKIYTSGPVMFAAWGYHYLPRIETIFLLSIVLMLFILFLTLGRRTGWWAPIVTGLTSSIWGLGFVSLMRFNFDPIMLVIPFILTARDLSHGIQWHGRYYDELDRNDDTILACAKTADLMLRPGILAVLANIAGIIFLAAGDIPVLRDMGYGGAFWLGASLLMVFVLQPILMSYLPRPRVRERSWLYRLTGAPHDVHDRASDGWFARLPVTPGVGRGILMLAGVALFIIGIDASRQVRIGYQTQGTPIYRADAKVNRDTAEIGKFLPTNTAWVVLETPNYPNPQSAIGINTLRMGDDLSNYLVSRGDAVAVMSFSTIATNPMNMLLHNGFPKYLAMPDSDQLSANLWSFFFGAAAPDEPRSYFALSPAMTNSCIRLFLPDHTAARLTRLRDDLDTFVRTRVKPDPGLSHVKLIYVGGDAGLYLATNDVVSHLNWVNLTLTLVAIFIFCLIAFRSVVAGLLFVAVGIAANFGAFLYMNAHDMGLTVDTIPVISLGIGLGLDFAIYTVFRIRDEVADGLGVVPATTAALRSTGKWVFGTYVVMAAGMIPWVFSPLLFQNEMSALLIILMTANLIVGVLMLPAFIAWRRSRFITRHERAAQRVTAAAS